MGDYRAPNRELPNSHRLRDKLQAPFLTPMVAALTTATARRRRRFGLVLEHRIARLSAGLDWAELSDGTFWGGSGRLGAANDSVRGRHRRPYPTAVEPPAGPSLHRQQLLRRKCASTGSAAAFTSSGEGRVIEGKTVSDATPTHCGAARACVHRLRGLRHGRKPRLMAHPCRRCLPLLRFILDRFYRDRARRGLSLPPPATASRSSRRCLAAGRLWGRPHRVRELRSQSRRSRLASTCWSARQRRSLTWMGAPVLASSIRAFANASTQA